MSKFNLIKIQKALVKNGSDGWIFYEYQNSDPIGRKILQLSTQFNALMRWFYYIPVEGIPVKIVHSLEHEILDHLPGKKEVYLYWQEMDLKLHKLFKGGEKIAAQYSPRNAQPQISKLDAGTFELLKSNKIKIVSSANLIQQFSARWTNAQLNMHKNAAKKLQHILFDSFKMIKQKIKNHEEINEFIVQQYIFAEMDANNLTCIEKPVVACGKNSGNPRYTPTESKNDALYPGSIMRLVLCAKEQQEKAVHAKIGWTAYLGERPPEEYVKNFGILTKARDKALVYITQSVKSNKKLQGWQVDDFVREIIAKDGYDSYFLHKTGNSLGEELDAYGAHPDNIETRDDREIINHIGFTIGPGLYFSDYGLCTEISVFINKNGAQVYTRPLQQNIVSILE
jgi:Xaa-Pro dipeptidase